MPSPFPGMDPWLESSGLFPDLHNTFIAYLREALAGRLPRPYYSAIATRVYVEDAGRQVEPDVDLFRPPGGRTEPAPVATSSAAPVIVRVPAARRTEWAIEVRDADSGDRLVTSIELLSPANKRSRSKGRRMYLKKRRELFRGRVNTVEFDLLRAGPHTTAVPLTQARRRAGQFDYHICVRRATRPEDFEVYPIQLALPLPPLAVPLLKGTPDVVVDCQPVFDRCYDIGAFGGRARYADPCLPPLTPDQQAWADEILRSKGLKP